MIDARKQGPVFSIAVVLALNIAHLLSPILHLRRQVCRLLSVGEVWRWRLHC